MYQLYSFKRYDFLEELIGTQKFFNHQVKPLKIEAKGMNIETLIYRHSLMPIVRPFMTKDRYEKLWTVFVMAGEKEN